jgi:hypothetical protein
MVKMGSLKDFETCFLLFHGGGLLKCPPRRKPLCGLAHQKNSSLIGSKLICSDQKIGPENVLGPYFF